MRPVRRAGTGEAPDGARVTWSIAEGRRGRRWRESVVIAGNLRHTLLLETAPDGRFSHLELATPAGLLTLHPEPDGTLHGNAIGAAGLRHTVGLPWDPGGIVLVDGSPVAAAAAADLLRPVLVPGASIERAALRVGPDLGVTVGRVRVDRPDARTWLMDGGDPCQVDDDGLPILAGAESWPLELPAE